MSFYESMVCLAVDRRLCGRAVLLESGHEQIDAINYWNVDKRLVSFSRGRRVREMIRSTPIEKVAVAAYGLIDRTATRIQFVIENWRLRGFFR